jgi:hypothetical protein
MVSTLCKERIKIAIHNDLNWSELTVMYLYRSNFVVEIVLFPSVARITV